MIRITRELIETRLAWLDDESKRIDRLIAIGERTGTFIVVGGAFIIAFAILGLPFFITAPMMAIQASALLFSVILSRHVGRRIGRLQSRTAWLKEVSNQYFAACEASRAKTK